MHSQVQGGMGMYQPPFASGSGDPMKEVIVLAGATNLVRTQKSGDLEARLGLALGNWMRKVKR